MTGADSRRTSTLQPHVRAALERLLAHAKTQAGSRTADFLLARWNAHLYGAFDAADLWSLDDAVIDDIVTVASSIGAIDAYAATAEYAPDLQAILRLWRPHLAGRSGAD